MFCCHSVFLSSVVTIAQIVSHRSHRTRLCKMSETESLSRCCVNVTTGKLPYTRFDRAWRIRPSASTVMGKLMKHTLYAFAFVSLIAVPAASASEDDPVCYLNGGVYSEGFSIGGLVCEGSKWVSDSDAGSAEICLHHNVIYSRGAIISIGSPIEDRNDNEKQFYQVCGDGGHWGPLAEGN